MDENKKVSHQKLLYDPLFDKKPDITLPDDPSKGLWGKTALKKALFIIAMVCFVGISIFFSFNSVSSDKYEYKENNDGYLLYSFRGQENDFMLSIDFVTDDNGNVDTSKPVNEVRQFAINCNEYLEYIYIADTVEKINKEAFYSCTSLRAFIVDPNNKNYASVDGVLYKKENGVLSEILMYPVRNGYYRTALALGVPAPKSAADTDKFNAEYSKIEDRINKEYFITGTSYVIPDTVELIGELCFSSCFKKDNEELVYALEHITIPKSVKRIETMAFFKCEALKEINLPNGLEYIGSDAFSSCKTVEYLFIPKTVTEIGHHAFAQCEKISTVFMEHESEENVELGEQWAPRTKKVFMVEVDVLYNQKGR